MERHECGKQVVVPTRVYTKIGALITKCIAAAECLNWKEIPHYFSNSRTHWSPWGPFLQLGRLNSLWLETARWLGNKGGTDLATFWDQRNMEWGGALTTLQAGSLSIDKVVLLGKIEDRLATIPMPFGTSALEWKAWC